MASAALPGAEPSVTAWVGYNRLSLSEFNNKLRREQNKPIHGVFNAALDFSPFTLGPNKLTNLSVPGGMEFLGAYSKTQHDSTTVNWAIPVMGVYVAPALGFWLKGSPTEIDPQRGPPPGANPGQSEGPARKGAALFVRPLGVGYYSVGKILPAKLTVSDRSGSMGVSGDAVGMFSEIGFRYFWETFFVSIGGGYRRLKFTDVSLRPKDGFVPLPGVPFAQPGNLPQDLDYSGFILRLGIGLRHRGSDQDPKKKGAE